MGYRLKQYIQSKTLSKKGKKIKQKKQDRNREKQCTYFCSFIKSKREYEIEEILEEIMA